LYFHFLLKELSSLTAPFYIQQQMQTTRNLVFIIMIAIACSIFCRCKSTEPTGKITVSAKIGLDEKIYLSKILFDGNTKLIDSAIVISNKEPLIFNYPNAEEGVYELTSTFNNFKIMFISDNNDLKIQADYFTRTASLNSAATNSLLKFRELQGEHAKLKDSIYFKNLINYEDTVKSPATFTYVFNEVDFGNNFQGLKEFIARAAKRFPSYQPVKDIQQHANNFLKIMEEEYNVGDQLPSLALPDRNNKKYSTAQLKGKLYFIDFWSTFCPACVAYTDVKKQALKIFPASRFAMVSVALDPEPADWKRYVVGEKLSWPQLIDQKVWEGTAVKTLKFDSIPTNFLVSREGKVLAKAIPKDSLLSTIRRFLKD
jgi:thiol-disulfide isomerase/thioredoxin